MPNEEVWIAFFLVTFLGSIAAAYVVPALVRKNHAKRQNRLVERCRTLFVLAVQNLTEGQEDAARDNLRRIRAIEDRWRFGKCLPYRIALASYALLAGFSVCILMRIGLALVAMWRAGNFRLLDERDFEVFGPLALAAALYALCSFAVDFTPFGLIDDCGDRLERGGWVEDIQEKQPFTDAPMQECASSGTYYFRSGAMALEYCRRTVVEGIALNGEYYASLVYKPMLRDGRTVAVYPLQHFMQWGTPEDLAIYRGWSRIFARLADDGGAAPRQKGAVLVPLAGAGARFAKEGYADPKPLVPVSGAPMVVQATRDLPAADRHVFVLRGDLPGRARIESDLAAAFPAARLAVLDALTDGQARTCLLALDQVEPDQPLTIGACDNGVLYDPARFEALMADPGVDVIVWVARRHPNAVRRPEMYGWVATSGDVVTSVSVKQPLADPAGDPIVIGTFTFKRARDFKVAAERMIARRGLVNGEYYVDTCINDAIALGLRCCILEVDAYISWGTPDELRTFEYWQSCFHKWQSHPYRLDKDRRVNPAGVAGLERRYAPPDIPRPKGR